MAPFRTIQRCFILFILLLAVCSTIFPVADCWQTQQRTRSPPSSSSASSRGRRQLFSKHRAIVSTCSARDPEISSPITTGSSRRDLLLQSASLTALIAAVATTTGASPAKAADSNEASAILLRLRSIPTFCIVDPNGVPFMIFDGGASATGYLFLSLNVALQALEDARSKDKNAGAAEVWSQAKIIVVPLAVAIQLALRKSQRGAVNYKDIKLNTFHDIVPSQEGVDDAKTLDANNNPAKWEQKGRVPLFYIPGMTLPDDGREPRYFNVRDLIAEWKRQHGDETVPKIAIVELVDLFRSQLSQGSSSSLANLAITPVAESNQAASQLLKSAASTLPKYDFSQVYLVGSSTS